ncbi:MAG: AsmA-like C-terminal region-containing protein [Pseudomonadota bacterium]
MTALLVVLVVVGAARLRTDPIPVGPWVTERVNAEAEAIVPGGALSFGSIRVGLDADFHPQVYLDDVALIQAGAPMLDLRRLRGDLAVGALIEGDLRLRKLALSGLVLRVARSGDGSFDISLGGAPGSGFGALRDLDEFFRRIDTVLDRPDFERLVEISAENVTINYSDGVTGGNWTGDGGQLRLFRDGADLLLTAEAALLTGRQDLATLSLSVGREGSDGQISVSAVVEDAAAADLASQVPALAWLAVLDAPVSVAMRTSVGRGGLDTLEGSLELGQGALRPNAASRPIPFTTAFMALAYDRAEQRLRFDEISLETDWGSATAHGTAQLQDFRGLAPREIVGQFTVDHIEGNPGGLYDAPRALDAVAADFRLRLDPFTLDVGHGVAVDGETTATVSGRIAAGKAGWRVAVDAAVDRVDAARARELWPESARPGLRRWLAANIEGGLIEDARWAIRTEPGEKPTISMSQRFRDAEVRILRSLPPITGGVGVMSVHDHQFTILVEEGEMQAPQGGVLDAAGSVFNVANMREKPATAEIDLRAAGTVTAVLSVLDEEPFRFLSKAGRPVTLADGRAEVAGRIAFPMKPRLRGSDVALEMGAELFGVRSTEIIAGKTLTLPRGRVTVGVDGITIAGSGSLGRVDFDGAWSAVFGQGPQPSEVRAEVALSPALLDEFGIDLPPGSVSGEGRGTLALSLPPQEAEGAFPRFSLRSDLVGLRVAVPPVSWVKPPASSGELLVEGRLGETPEVEALVLRGPGFSAEGRITLAPGGTGLRRADFSRVSVGNWLVGRVALIGRGVGRPPAVSLRQAALDLRGARFGESAGGADGPPLEVSLDQLVVSEDIILTNLRGDFTTTGGLAGVFTAQMNGGTALQGRVQGTPDGPRIRVESADGGGVIRDAGLFRQVQGGNLALNLEPRAGEGVFDGRVTLSNIRVTDAPSMAALLSAISVVGLLEQMDGGGLVFSDVEADFRLTPAQVIVTESSATGASLGISLDGIFDLRNRSMDFQGVVSPFYLVNSIGSFLTRRGEGLIGFNFNLRGPAAAPEVSVNPLSVLTPGMFREIFRRAPPEVSQ